MLSYQYIWTSEDFFKLLPEVLNYVSYKCKSQAQVLSSNFDTLRRMFSVFFFLIFQASIFEFEVMEFVSISLGLRSKCTEKLRFILKHGRIKKNLYLSIFLVQQFCQLLSQSLPQNLRRTNPF